MARIVGGIGSSHAPSIAFAWDAGHRDRPEWKPFFDAYDPVKDWMAALRPDTVVVIYNDHFNRFRLDTYPTFALGCADLMPVADEGRGKRPLPDVPGNSDLSWHLSRSLVADEFDITMCQEMALDHGVMSILPLVTDVPWKVKVVPLAVNVILHPLPSVRRCWKLGEALARGIDSFPADERVVVMATGGLSHQLQGADFGFLNPEWDEAFLDRVENDPESLLDMTHDELMDRGGAEGVEVIMWLAMRGALRGPQKRIQRNYWAPVLTGYGLLALEPDTGGR